GTPGYTYSIDGGQNYQPSNEFTGLTAGNYTITIKDANGCTKTCDEVVVGQPDALTCSTTPTDASCNSGSDGKITVTAGGGTPGYTYSIDGGQNYQPSNEFTGLTAGNYTITIKDANGCTKTCDEVTVGEPDPLTFCITQECAGANVSPPMTIITVYPIGGTPGYEYYVFDNDDNVIYIDWKEVSSGDEFSLPDGNYTLKLRDANGCVALAQECVPLEPVVDLRSTFRLIPPSDIEILASCCRISCNDAGVFECSDAAGIEEWLNGGAFTIEGDCEGLRVDHNLDTITGCGDYIVTFTIVDENGDPDLDDQGQPKTCTNTLTIQDTKAPVIVVSNLKKLNCSEVTIFDEPEIFDNCDNDVEVKVTTEWYIDGLVGCRHRRTWTATDDCGNTSTATQVIQIVDPTLPELVPVHPLLEGLADGDSIYVECSKPTFFSPEAFEVKEDCSKCGHGYKVNMDDYAIIHDCGDGKALKEIVCWWYVTDKYDRTVRYTIHIFMMDRMPPEFVSVPEDKTIACDAPIEFGEVVTFDACSKYVSLSHQDTLGTSAQGQSTITRIWRATDACGNWDTASQTITLEGSGPVFTSLPENKILSAGSEVVFDEPVARSACGEVNITVDGADEVSGDQCSGLTYTRTWNAVSENGLSATTSQTITLKPDDEAPVFNKMPGNVVLPCGSDLPAFNIGVTDNVDDGVVISVASTMEGEGCDQVITRTWTATDACGNATSVSQEVRFAANLDITFTYVPGTFSGKIGDMVPEDMAVASSDCTEGEVAISVEDRVVQDATCDRSIHRLFIATDGCGNRDTAIQLITLIDNVAPVLTNTIAGKSVECGDSINFDEPEFTDNVGVEAVVVTDTVIQEQCSGYYKRTWLAVDSCGNSTTVTQTITILPDTEAPVFASSDQVLVLGCQDTIPAFTPAATDNCASSVSIVMEETESKASCEERISRIWTATDSCGNSSTLKWELIRRDTLAPKFDHIPEDFSVTCIEDAVFDTITVEDDCSDSVQLSFMDLKREGNCFTGFTLTRTWIATDDCGNMNQVVQNIFVIGDTVVPLFTEVPADTIIRCGDSIPSQTVEVADNCRIDTIMVQQDHRPINDHQCEDSTGYFVQRSWIAVDECGNLDTAIQYIAILGAGQSSLMTFIEVPGTQVVNCADDAVFGRPVVKATCDSVQITTEDFTIGEPCSAEYKMIREWTATDTCGQTVSTYQTIIVRQDTSAPHISLDYPVKFMGCGSVKDTLSFDDPTVWDNCVTELVSTTDTTIHDNSDADSVRVRTWTYADQCGNESSISQKLIFGLNDTDDFFRAERDTFALSCVTAMELHRPVVYSCDTVSVSYEDAVSDSACMNQLKVVRTWTAADTSGNVDSYVQIFNIHDTIAPVIELASDTLYMTSLEYAGFEAESNLGPAADNCGQATDDISSAKQEENGRVWYEYTVTRSDQCGNTSIAHFVVVIAEKPPIVNLNYSSPDVVAQVSGGVAPFEYAWSYLRPGNPNWVSIDIEGKKLSMREMGMIQKVKVRVMDARDQWSENQLDLMVTKNVRRNVMLHPNPAVDYVEVRMEMEDVNRIELYNMLGQRVKFYEFDRMTDQGKIQLDLRDVPQGTYTVRFMNDYRVYTRPLIKVN
ncbi:T9SS type A sorting domain-containing protein, partial [Membranicola marinus]